MLLIVLLINSTAQNDGPEDLTQGWLVNDTSTAVTYNGVSAINGSQAIIVGNGGSILTTYDRGSNWVSEQLGTTNFLDIDTKDNVSMVVGDEGVVFIGSPGSWLNISINQSFAINGVSITNASSIEETVAFIAGDDGEIWKTENGGTDWVNHITSTSEDLNDIDFFDHLHGIAVGDNGAIVVTIDGGQTWEIGEVPQEAASYDFYGVSYPSSVRAYLVGDNGIFLRSSLGISENIGFNWNLWDTGVTTRLRDVDAVSTNKVWVVGDGGTILSTSDGGNLFKTQNMSRELSDFDILSISMYNVEVGYQTGTSGHFLYTISGGVSEQELRTVKDYSNFRIYLEEALPILWEGFTGMLKIVFLSIGLGFVIGIIVALMKTANVGFLRFIGTVYTDFFRNTPLLVQLLIVHFGLIEIGIDLTFNGTFQRSLISSILGLGLNSGAYQAEIIRSGILAIPVGQMEAGRSIGLTYLETMRFIILPQALRIVIPPLGNEFINLTLNTSLASITGLLELVRAGTLIIATTFKTFQTWILVALFYFVVTYSMTNVLRYSEKRMKIPGLGLGET